jgi:hypothetical protein
MGLPHHFIYVCLSVELAIPVRFSALCNQCKQRLEGTDKNFQLREKLWPEAANTNVCRLWVAMIHVY